MFDGIQQCPRCEGLIDREHFACIECPNDEVITYLYCEHCDWGRETIWTVVNDWPYERLSVDYDAKKDARKLGRFEQRLKEVRSDAA